MSKFEDNPFSDPAIDNPFAVRSPSLLEEMYCYFAFPANICVFFQDPAVQQVARSTNNATQGLDDYNPFDGQQNANQATVNYYQSLVGFLQVLKEYNGTADIEKLITCLISLMLLKQIVSTKNNIGQRYTHIYDAYFSLKYSNSPLARPTVQYCNTFTLIKNQCNALLLVSPSCGNKNMLTIKKLTIRTSSVINKTQSTSIAR